MKVLDLQCGHAHVFEGWFASEDDFASQLGKGLVACPLCANTVITKKLSAPRLNLGHTGNEVLTQQAVTARSDLNQALQAAWLSMARQIASNTDDVGSMFAEEARKIHYGEVKERGIRGQATAEETESLIDEGIAVMPLLLPDLFKGPLQ